MPAANIPTSANMRSAAPKVSIKTVDMRELAKKVKCNYYFLEKYTFNIFKINLSIALIVNYGNI